MVDNSVDFKVISYPDVIGTEGQCDNGTEFPPTQWQFVFSGNAVRMGTKSHSNGGIWYSSRVIEPERFGPVPTFDDIHSRRKKAIEMVVNWTTAFFA